MKSITVFTPTYNRAFCLGQVYDSLVSQTVKDFVWLIVDDGSTDNTKALVESWQQQNLIEIEYVYKQNHGMHTGHNTAYQNIKTELNTCIDSDDYMPNDAIENILNLWKRSGSDQYAGIIGLDAFKSGEIVGTAIPADVKEATLGEIYDTYKVTGDKKMVLRTEVVKQFPLYPVFENEKLVPLGTLYKMIDQKYKCLCSNDVYCIVEYLPDGSSNNILKQYRKSPKGFFYSRLLEMRYSKSLSRKFTCAMHLVSSALFAKQYNIFKDNPEKLLTFIAIPFGLALHVYILIKTAK